jgi:hypothetical protein
MRLGSCVKRPAFSRACSVLVRLIFIVALVVFVFKYWLVLMIFFFRARSCIGCVPTCAYLVIDIAFVACVVGRACLWWRPPLSRQRLASMPC